MALTAPAPAGIFDNRAHTAPEEGSRGTPRQVQDASSCATTVASTYVSHVAASTDDGGDGPLLDSVRCVARAQGSIVGKPDASFVEPGPEPVRELETKGQHGRTDEKGHDLGCHCWHRCRTRKCGDPNRLASADSIVSGCRKNWSPMHRVRE